MSDNFQANAGSGGSYFGSDEVGGIHYPRVKKSVGPDGVAQDCWTPFRVKSAASTNAQNIKSASAALGYLLAINIGAAVRFLKLYNKASAPNLAVDVPVATIPIPASTTGAGVSLAIPDGAAFPLGLSLAITGGAGDTDATAVAADEVFLFGGYA